MASFLATARSSNSITDCGVGGGGASGTSASSSSMAAAKNSDALSEVSETGTVTSGGLNSNWSSREELRDLVAKHGLTDISDLYQERFRVDRKKLELMLSEDNEALVPADVFFAKVMEDTDTYITWPNKLKLGAKTKKDPHVRIAGAMDDVQAARERIVAILFTRENRVTMKMDISFTDHSHIIGRGGLTIKRVMEETQCHVHFPDSNRSNPVDKSNQVSISGEIAGVELARSRVRELIPLIFGFEPPIMANNIDLNHPFVGEIQDKFKVQVMFKTRSKLHATIVLVKGVEWEVQQVKQATLRLMDFMCENLAGQIPVQMSIQISPQHHQAVLGKSHVNLKTIMQQTNCQILFPDALDNNIPNLKRSNVTISGNIHNVYSARQLLMGSLPLLIIFDLPEDTGDLRVKAEQLAEIQNSCDVTINIRQKSKQVIRACVIKGVERQADNIYRARNLILNLEEPPIHSDIPPSYHLPPITLSTSPSATSVSSTTNSSSLGASQQSTSSGLAAFFGGGSNSNNNNMDLQHAPTTNPNSLMFPWHYPPSGTYMGLSGSPGLAQFQLGNVGNNKPFAFGSLQQQQQVMTGLVGTNSFQTFSSGLDEPKDVHSNTTLSSISTNSSTSSFGDSVFNSPQNQRYRHFNQTASGVAEKISQEWDKEMTTSDYHSMVAGHPDLSKPWRFEYDNNNPQDQKIQRGYEAMRAPPTPGAPRMPTDTWSGYGISHTSPAGFTPQKQQHYSVSAAAAEPEQEEEKNGSSFPFSPNHHHRLNSSNALEHTSNGFVRRVVEDKSGDLPTLLTNLGLGRYVGLFLKHEVDLVSFASFSESDLVTLGVCAFGSRRKMMLAIAELNKRQGTFSAAPGAERRSTSSNNSATPPRDSPSKWQLYG